LGRLFVIRARQWTGGVAISSQCRQAREVDVLRKSAFANQLTRDRAPLV